MRVLYTCLLFSCLLFSGIMAQPVVQINEVLASNISTNADMVDFGDFSDWIELYNTQPIPVNISGYYLSDDPDMPTKWQFPSGSEIPANGYLLIWADDFDDIPGNTYTREWWPYNIPYTTTYYHTNFKLNKDGETLSLYDADRNLLDSIQFGPQAEDVSFGRNPVNKEQWGYFGEPSPGRVNDAPFFSDTQKSGALSFSIDGGFYSGTQSVALNSISNSGTIHYTLDGTTPTSGSPVYTTPILINKNTTVSARLFEADVLPGEVFSNTYLFDEIRNLPAFAISADYAYLMAPGTGIYRNTLKEREIPVSVSFFPLGEETGFSQRAGMRIGGENIFRFAQKPLNIYARGDYGESEIEYQVFDRLPYQAFKRLYLRNSGDDWPYTMIRDGMISSILRDEVSNSTQAYRPVVLYLNNEYKGIYNLREKLDKQYFSLHYSTSEVDLDHLESDATVIEGDNTDYLDLLNYANSNDLSQTENYNQVTSQIDVPNLMDFVIVSAYLANSSWGHNREMWRDRGNDNKWRWVLVDMDRGFNDSRISSNQIADLYNNFDLFRSLTSNTAFRNTFVQRYAERLHTTFKSNRVIQIIDSLQQQIEPEMPRHIQTWSMYIDSLTIDEWGQTAGIQSMQNWFNEIESFRTFATQRPTEAIQNLSDQFGLGDLATLTVESNIPGSGKVDLNGFFKEADFSGSYFTGIPLSFTAYAPPGYTFSSWKLISSDSSAEILIPTRSSWKYFDKGMTPGTDWQSASYDDASWSSGPAILGYGDDQSTLLNYGPDSGNKYITTYFRKEFSVSNISEITQLTLKLLRDDGAVVYLNGNEIARSNIASGSVSYSTVATNAIGGSDESTYFEFDIPVSELNEGTNLLAVEVHQISGSSSDLSFDASLTAQRPSTSSEPQTLSEEPELTYTLSGNTVLLVEFETSSESFIPATISDTTILTLSNSPYLVEADVNIDKDGLLQIEAGVEIKFNEGTGIFVQGKLEGKGTQDQPVKFLPYYPGHPWSGLFIDSSFAHSELRFSHVFDATGLENHPDFFAAVSVRHSSLTLDHVTIDQVKLPVSSQFSNLRILNSSISNVYMVGDYLNVNGGNLWVSNSIFEGNNIEDMDAIDIGFMKDSTLITGNIFSDFAGDNTDAIDVGDASENVIITHNRITHCGDKAVSIGQASEAYVAFNIIVECNLGAGIKDEGSFGEFVNNTFYKTNIGVAAYEKVLNRGGGSAEITNSIFLDMIDTPVSADEFSTISVSYSISNSTVLPGIGNLLGAPELINPKGDIFYPQTNAVVLHSGDPEILLPDGSRSHIGALSPRGMMESAIVINEINYHSSDTFDAGDWVEFYNNSSSSTDMSGWVFTDGSKEQTYVFDQRSILPAKAYYVIAREPELFTDHFPSVSILDSLMNNGLSGSGESLFLYNSDGYLTDSLTFTDDAPWPTTADGDGPTLELVNPDLDNGLVNSWAASAGNGTPGSQNSQYFVNNSPLETTELPSRVALYQNYPNPFNPTTNIAYDLPVDAFVTLKVYDIVGREVRTLVNSKVQAGHHATRFEAGNLSSGIYFYTLTTNDILITKKLTLIK
tara:strand:+ start:5397 stop:10085 length:4689 start_codon:yes stop_codon:yes gene_type:complete